MPKLTELEAQIAKLQAEAEKERDADPATQLRAAAQELREAAKALDEAREALQRATPVFIWQYIPPPVVYPQPYTPPVNPWWNPGRIVWGTTTTHINLDNPGSCATVTNNTNPLPPSSGTTATFIANSDGVYTYPLGPGSGI